MQYGKIIEGKLHYAPSILNKDNKQYINPPMEMYIELGYLPIQYTEIPKQRVGYQLIASWYQDKDKLIQKWHYELEKEEISAPIFEFAEMEIKDELPEGDYMNPIHLLEGGLISQKNKWYYVDDKAKPHMAIIEGFVSPRHFNDSMWFYFN